MNKKLRDGLFATIGVLVMGVALGYLFFWAIDTRLQRNEKLYTTYKD